MVDSAVRTNELLGPFFTVESLSKESGWTVDQIEYYDETSKVLLGVTTKENVRLYPLYQFDELMGFLPGIPFFRTISEYYGVDDWTLALWLKTKVKFLRDFQVTKVVWLFMDFCVNLNK